MDPIPSIPETAARGTTAAIYRDIKATLGAPSINLIWGHLATIPGALPAVWSTVRPLYSNRNVQRCANEIRATASLPDVRPWARNELLGIGIGVPEIRLIDAVLANYDDTNALNLIVLCSLSARLSGTRSSVKTDFKTATLASANTRRLPAFVPEADMDQMTRTNAHALNRIGLDPPPAALVAGVPRHLANWPEFLALGVRRLSALGAAIGESIVQIRHNAMRDGSDLSGLISIVSEVANQSEVRAVLDYFTSLELIPNYVVKLRVLRDLLGTATSPD